MKIKSLEIYGYGKFIQRKIEFDESFTEIYGENEAGKSTIQAFIHSILFGFPTKKENEPRLEPRLGNQYGGKLTLIQDDGSLVDVERIKGSATGDVKVYLPNGTIKDETWLNKELNFISKRTYQGIFSFDVLGLQDIHRKMDETQLQNYLLQAGALGSTEFTSMREILSNKKEMLYKKNGRNPIINQQLEQLKELEGQIREEEAKLTSYKRLVDDKDKAERRLSTLKQNLTQLSKMHEQKQKEIALHEQTQEWKQLETQLNIEPIVFPEQGIDRYESAKIQTQNLKRDIGLREERLAHLKTENEKVNVPKQSDIDAFNHLHQQENEIKQKEYELKSVEKEIEDKKREKSGLSSNIGWQDVHHQVDDSEAMKSHVSNQIKNKQEQTAYIQQLERNIEENKIDKDTNNAEIESLEADIVPEENFEKKKQYNKRVFELQEKNNLYQKMKEAFDTEQRENEKKQNLLRIALMVLAVIGIGLTIFSFVSANIIFGIVFAILSLVFITGLFFVKTKEIGHSETFSKEIDDLQQQVNHLEDNYDLDFDLDDQYRVREQYQTAIKTKEAINKKAAYLEDTLEQAKQHYQTAQNNINDVKSDLFLSNKMSDELIIDSINTMNKIKEHDVHITELHKKAHELQQQLDEFYAHAQEITKNQFSYFNKLSLFHDIRQWLKEETNNLDKWNRNNEQIKLLESEVSQLHNRLNENSNVISQLFNFVNVNDEESYYQHHVQHQNYHQQMARFNDLSKYLENQNYNYDSSSRLSEKTAAQLTNEDEVLARQVDDYNDQYLELQSQVSDLNAKITDMETDKTLADLRHRFHILKNKVNDEAKDWASLSYLQALVEGHIKQIKDKRLPQVINEATNIFSHLTNGHYVQVTYANDDLMVKQVNGQMYEPVELSQSTKEILYIALRLSLIQTLKPYYPFPIIIDDAFVHFDKYRKDIMMNYLRQMPSSYQILYFTCVKDTSVPSKQIITLNKIEEGGK
ncbi:AAA family ATPase [Staphylococcus xylosus]|uniref:ATP-binding protein n=1 Tax=Staphylococcus xylosus TaxID=1288 RepID=UPI001CDD0C0E|nr:AAA family ATPase [Staphylococcus xylosus]MCE4994058.1 AAA family ATPase [Staphylococcus xylosus]MEB8306652.1 AAA family ATPase [Staphylococcus xylosus]UBV41070.1 AAA family ATPase [Staphylococcus xylosus]